MQSKNKECIICHRDDQPWFSKKRCKRCATIQDSKCISRSAISPDKKITTPKANNGTALKAKNRAITKQTAKNKLKRATARAGYGEFFQRMIQRITDEKISCENCGNQLTGHVSECAHILSKSKHPEVATVEGNVLFLCGMYSNSQCHADFDSSLSKRFSMTVAFSAAKEKYKLFKHLVTTYSKERQQLEDE